MPLADNKQITASDIVARDQQDKTQEDNRVAPAEVLTIDTNKEYTFGGEKILGEKLLNWASLGKLDSSERVQGERDRLRQEKEAWLTEARQKEVELSQYKTQSEMLSKQLEQFQTLLPKQEQEPSAIEQLFEQYEQPATQRRYAPEEPAEGNNYGTDMNVLRQAFQAQMQDISKLIESRLNEVDNKLQTVPSHDDLTKITNNFTQQQQERERQQQRYALTTQKMQEVENRLIQQRGWTPEQARDYSLVREQAVELSRQAQDNTGNPVAFADLYSQAQLLDDQSRELLEKFDTETQTKQNNEQEVAMTQTWQPQMYQPPKDETGDVPKYVTNSDYRSQALRDAREVLHKHKITG